MKRILLIDDQAMVRAGLALLLTQNMDLEAVDEAGDPNGALKALGEADYDLVLMDVRIQGRSRVDCMRDIRRRYPALPVLVVSTYPEDQYAVRALRAGASGYLSKCSPPRELITAVRKVLAGERYISDRLAQALAGAFAAEGDELPHTHLSERELQVMLGLAQGRTVTEIANDFNLSVKTVSTYRTRVLQKMGLNRNAELVRYAVEHDLG